MHRRKARLGQFERMNERRENLIAALRRKMVNAAMAGGRSGFAVQIRTGRWPDDTAITAIRLREARLKER